MNKTRGILLIAGIVGISLLGAFFFRDKGLGATLPVAGQTYTLAGSGITASNTSSITLSSLTIPQTGYKLQDSDFSPTFYLTFEPGSTKRQEIASCTTVVQNANNSATLSGCTRGLLPFTPFTASSSYAFSHAGGTSVIFSDPPQLFNEFVAKDNDATITGLINFTQLPLGPTSTPTNQQQFITLYQFQQATTTGGVNGSETAKGVFEGATQAEMAAGTVFGSTGATLTLLSKYATSTITGTGSYLVVTRNSDGKIDASFGGGASSIATLNSNSLVVQNPASAQVTSTFSKIPMTSATTNTLSGTFFGTTTPGAVFYVGSDGFVKALTASGGQHLVITASGTAAELVNPYAAGTGEQAAGGTGDQIITHNLGGIPTLIEITAVTETDGAGAEEAHATSFGVATSTGGGNATWFAQSLQSLADLEQGRTTTNTIFLVDNTTAIAARATITAISTTTFTINWAVNTSGNTNSTRYFTWKAYR